MFLFYWFDKKLKLKIVPIYCLARAGRELFQSQQETFTACLSAGETFISLKRKGQILILPYYTSDEPYYILYFVAPAPKV